ncbi:MAG: bifunctional folylpolyglutamate synthase/dihydrofolate synthase [Clostridia bacterium]|nr:bifunctional folylpolyglutamate synthase/dihydrofolate synthase [Clostridia bacterium]
MTYNEAIDYIMSRRKFQKSSSHERIARLLELLGSPEKELKFVHIAGTNGKGSVSTALSFIFKKAGYRVGLFTSPFIVEFGERIQVNNTYISHGDISSLTALIKEKTDLMESEDLYPTVFEVTTALAFLYFAKEDCDIVFLEAGIGGEHDSTNVIPAPLECIFTSISLDHTEMLGDTVEKIAAEKSGIIKEGSTVISYPDKGESFGYIAQKDEAVAVIRAKCMKTGCSFYMPETDKLTLIKSDIHGSVFIYDGLNITTSLCGAHQIANIITAVVSAKQLCRKGFDISDNDIISGIASFKIPGRMETVSVSPLVILDGGHNEGCMKALCNMIKAYLSDKKITLLMSFMKDKDYASSLGLIAPLCENIVFTQTDFLRGETPEALKESAAPFGGNIFCERGSSDAYKKALSLTDKDGALIVAGSFYLVSEIRKFFK